MLLAGFDMMLVNPLELQEFATRALVAGGARVSDAELTAAVLVSADLSGVDSHGVARLRRYVEGLHSGDIDRSARPQIVVDAGGVCVVDAHNGLGQPALCMAVDTAVERAMVYGVGAVAVRRSNHIGIASWFAERAVQRGMFAFVTTNAVPQVAPVGTNEPMFGTDPICYAVPSDDGPICFDGATSTVSRGKLEQLDREGKPMLSGWALGPDGHCSTDIPRVVAGLKARAGFALTPVGGLGQDYGGHKGSGLALLVELLCGPLAGAQWSRHTYAGAEAELGHFVLCLNISSLGDADMITTEVSRLASEVRGAKPAGPTGAVRMPGDRRRHQRQERSERGIPLLDSVVTDLSSIATTMGIAPVPVQGMPC